ncbi:hypothetical protein BLA60_14400 [Actinophytocola xinjiangensis]|uniref:DUF3558 domain-containing protein n=1 Tax=Actinophytocola xinjiangensis TaxID=485602 RepID=A0A7Z0WNR1_9PSEU|nr:hypothetical protein BLA60_14400 [Actinophytocola xinjiangensis]
MLSGCSDEGANPTPASEPAEQTSLVIPEVGRPLEVGADACALLDERQRRELGLPGVVRGDGDGTCDLHRDAQRPDESDYLRIVVFAEGGLADQYAQCGTLDCSRWTTDSIDGYPVIRAADELTAKYRGCKIFLGVSDTSVVTFVDVAVGSGAGGEDCARAERAAGMVLVTLG